MSHNAKGKGQQLEINKKNMYEYGNLIYDATEGWLFVKQGKKEDLKTETLISSLNGLGKKGWELVTYDSELGYLLKLRKEKDK